MVEADLSVDPLQSEDVGMIPTRQLENLVQHLRERGIRNEAVLKAISEVPRHRFVSDAVARYAYHDDALPIGHNQTISQPYIVALMTQALLEPDLPQSVLEIGTGSGYQSAVLAKLVRQVYSIERIPQLHKQSTRLLRELGIDNVSTHLGDGSQGLPTCAPYEAIIVTAAAPTRPDVLCDQLVEGGRLVVPEGSPNEVQMLMRYVKTPEGMTRKVLLDVLFVPLISQAD